MGGPVNVSLNATIDEDGNVVCALACDAQQAVPGQQAVAPQRAIITFTPDDVLVDIPRPA